MSNFSIAGSSLKSGSVVMLKDVKIPDRFYNRIKTSSTVLDQIFGGDELSGLMPGSAVLFTGVPGGGKSTTMLQLVDTWANAGHSVLYNVGEENEYAIKYRAQKLGLTCAFPISKFNDVNDLCQFVIDAKIEIVIQDSLQSIESDNLDGHKLLKNAVEQLTSLSKEHGVTVFMIGHVTKGGMASGPQKIFHDIDMHAHLSFNKDTGGRVFEMKKNRFGPSGIQYEFSMSEDGMQFSELSGGADSAKPSSRKDKALETIKELLLQGHKLSAYSCEDVDEIKQLNISGSLMRMTLRVACNELANNGKIIGSENINRREHFYIEV